jgi:hypothetical protein
MNARLLHILACLPLLAAAAAAQSAVRLVTVPDQVRLPAAPGANLLLEVECATAPEAIWLATEELARDSVPLQAAGSGRYQLNLADARVGALVPAGLRQGELFVFARAGGRVAKSAAIVWSSSALPAPALQCLLRSVDGTSRPVSGHWPIWLDPQRCRAVEVLGDPARDGVPVLRSGGFEAPLARADGHPAWRLVVADLPDEVRTAGAFEIEVRGAAAPAVGPFHFRLAPARLDLADGKAALLVDQRGSAAVPGSREWLWVRLGDITMGRVALEVTNAGGGTLVEKRHVHERDFVEFTLAEARYVLTIDKLVNRLVGQDCAELTVRPAAGFVPDRIGQLLRAVEASQDTFVRDGSEFDGAAAAQFLLVRVSAPARRKITVDEFVDDVASKSSQTGEAYMVKKRDGTLVTMQQWLRAELQQAGEQLARPTCVLEIVGDPRQFQPIAVRATIGSSPQQACQWHSPRLGWARRVDGQWLDVVGLGLPGSEGVDVVWAITPQLQSMARVDGLWMDPAVLSWHGHYRVNVSLAIAWLPSPGAARIERGVRSEWVEFDIVADQRPAGLLMQRARDAGGELWRDYRQLMGLGRVWDGAFRRKEASDAAIEGQWRDLAARHLASEGREAPQFTARVLEGQLGQWAIDVGGKVRYTAHVAHACLALNSARRLSEYSEVPIEPLPQPVELEMRAVDAELSAAATAASTSEERLLVMGLQMRAAQLRGRSDEVASLRSSITGHQDWAAVQVGPALGANMVSFIRKGGM